MNIPVNPTCRNCKEPYVGSFMLGDGGFDWSCAQCGQTNFAVLALDFTIGFQVWQRATYEWTQTRDASMAVVLSAMAVDSGLSFFFQKWTSIIVEGQRGYFVTDVEIEELLFKLTRIADKFKEVSKLLVGMTFQQFVESSPHWRSAVAKDLPELNVSSLVKSIEVNLFWPRNRILHAGKPATMVQAELAVRIAKTCLDILNVMDYEKRKSVA
jgi:hypothetical protein